MIKHNERKKERKKGKGKITEKNEVKEREI